MARTAERSVHTGMLIHFISCAGGTHCEGGSSCDCSLSGTERPFGTSHAQAVA